MDGGLFGEEHVGAVQRQIAVDLVGRDLMIAGDAVLAAGVHQHLGTQNVGPEKYLGILDGTVHMALGGKIHHHIGLFFLKQAIHALPVADIQLHKAEVGVIHHGRKGA